MTQLVYRLTIDENGQDDCTDYTGRDDAYRAFNKAKGREGVFSVRLEALRYDGAEATSVKPMDYWEYEGRVGLQHP